MATPSATNHPDQTDESAVKTTPAQRSGDGDQSQSTSTSGIETNQGRSATPSSEQSLHGDQHFDSHAEKKNDETGSNTQQRGETSSGFSGSADQQGGRIETSTTTTTTTSSGGSTYGEESTSTNVSSASKSTEASSTGSDETKKEESNLAAASPSSSAPTDNIDCDLRKEQSSPQLGTAGAFHIAKGNGQHLTEFQRQKAKYFFNVNLDIENKEFLKWEDVEFYLLFHVTAADKEGSNGGDLEARLSRAARALWENIHDQVPLADGKRENLTLDQFLDTWASIADYVVHTNQLPPLVEDLVKVGFELYATDDDAEKHTKSIPPNAFDQLFQKMNLGRPYAIMAYKILTDNGSTPLDANKIESIVRSVITSSDDEHSSHFLLPGFFKTIANHQNRNKSNSPVQGHESSEKSATSTTPTSSTASTGTTSQTTTTTSTTQSGQSNARSTTTAQGPPSPSRQPSKPSESESFGQNTKGPESSQQFPSTGQVPQPAPRAVIQQEDEGIRQLLRYYHIDDGDLVEVTSGSGQRVVLVHPERPLPQYIQQNKELLQKIQSGPTPVSSNTTQPLGSSASKRPTVPPQNPQSRVFLEERIARGEVQQGPTVPYRQEPQLNRPSTAGARQVYPGLSPAEQEQQRRQAQLQAAAPSATAQDGKSNAQSKDQANTSPKNEPSSVPAESKEKKDFTREDEERIVACIVKQLTPLIERRVAEELRYPPTGDTDDDDDDGFLPFPFVFAGPGPIFAGGRGGPPPAQAFGQQQQHQQQRGPPQGINFDGLPPGAAFIPPELLMAMMNDLAGGDTSGFSPNRAPPSQGPTGVQGFAMFADGPPTRGGAPGYPPRYGPSRF